MKWTSLGANYVLGPYVQGAGGIYVQTGRKMRSITISCRCNCGFLSEPPKTFFAKSQSLFQTNDYFCVSEHKLVPVILISFFLLPGNGIGSYFNPFHPSFPILIPAAPPIPSRCPTHHHQLERWPFLNPSGGPMYRLGCLHRDRPLPTLPRAFPQRQ